MSRIYLSVKMNVVVDTDLTDPSEIMDNIEISAVGDDSDVMVLDSEVEDYDVTYAK